MFFLNNNKQVQISCNTIVIIFVVLVLASCKPSPSAYRSPWPELKVSGKETWIVNGKSFNINSTAVIFMPNSPPLFVIRVMQAPSKQSSPPITIGNYAVRNGYFKKAQTILEEHNNQNLAKCVGIEDIRGRIGAIDRYELSSLQEERD